MTAAVTTTVEMIHAGRKNVRVLSFSKKNGAMDSTKAKAMRDAQAGKAYSRSMDGAPSANDQRHWNTRNPRVLEAAKIAKIRRLVNLKRSNIGIATAR
jgi:hypothetical protein